MKEKRKTQEQRDKSQEARMRKQYIDKGIETVIDRLRMERRRRNILPQTLFDLFDVDKNGSLSAEELEDALVRMKMPHTGVEVEGMIFMYDRDKDGLLDYREFLELVTGGTSKHANDFRTSRKAHPAHKSADDYEYSDEESFHKKGADGHYIDRTVIHSSEDEISSDSSSSSDDEHLEFSSDDEVDGLSSLDKKLWHAQKKRRAKKTKLNEKRRKREKRKQVLTKMKRPKRGGGRKYQTGSIGNEQLVSSVPLDMRRLELKLHGAEGLPPMDANGSSDPFVMITCGKKVVKSKVLKSTLTPTWDQVFLFGDPKEAHRRRRRFSFTRNRADKSPESGLKNVEKVRLVVKDWNRTGAAQFIGQVDIDLMMMEGQPIDIPIRMMYPLLGLKSRGRRGSQQMDLLGDTRRAMVDISLMVTQGKSADEDE